MKRATGGAIIKVVLIGIFAVAFLTTCELLSGDKSTVLVIVNGSAYPMDTLYVAPGGTGYSSGFSGSTNLLSGSLASGASLTVPGAIAGTYDVEAKIEASVPTWGGQPWYASPLPGSYPAAPETVNDKQTTTLTLQYGAPW
jgi:hypothetical protein